MVFSFLSAYPFETTTAEETTMDFATGEIIDFHSSVEMSFWSGESMFFRSGIIVEFTEVSPDGWLTYCDFIASMSSPSGYVPQPCDWWELLDPEGIPTGIEFHIDEIGLPPDWWHVDMVYPDPVLLPYPVGMPFTAEKKIDKIAPCNYFVVHEPSEWYPAECSWWEIIDPETHEPTGFEFHVDWTSESCEFHIDEMIPGPYALPFPWHQIEARRKITGIYPCDWFTILDPAGFRPDWCSWWEVLNPDTGEPTGLEFHVDDDPGDGTFHVDETDPPLGFDIPMLYTVRVRQKITALEPCSWFEVDDLTTTPKPCTWWKIVRPEWDDVEFHVDESDPITGRFHIDDVLPSPYYFPPYYQFAAEKKFVGISPCDWFRVEYPHEFLPTVCSWWRITWPPEWAGIEFHVDSTDGIDKFHIDMVPDPVPSPPIPPPWNVTAEEFTPPVTWYWKPAQVDYAPSGVPDFDQRQWGTYIWQDMWGQWSHCGPVAVANSLWWLDSEFEPSPILPPTINDGFPLVQAYGLWDDHDPQNVPWLVEHLAYLMDTDGQRTGMAHSGTDVYDMEAGLAHYLSWTGVNPVGDVNGDGIVDALDETLVMEALGTSPGAPNWDLAADIYPASLGWPPFADNIIDTDDLVYVQANMGRTGLFYEHTVMNPDFFFIEEEVERCQDVVLLVGYWIYDPTPGGGWYREPGGHYVTVAGVDSTNLKLALSDPVQDAFESGVIPEGRIPVPHVHTPPEPPYITHNDAQYVSQDIYNVAQITPMWPPCPGGDWMLVNFAGWSPAPFFAVIEFAVVTSPLAEHDLAVIDVTTSKQGCLPVPTIGRNYTLQINVTVENQGGFVESFFDVWTELSLELLPPITVGPVTVASLAPGDMTTLTFNWDTTGAVFGNYTVTGVVETVSGETETADNRLNGVYIFATLPGDINGDKKVDILDAIKLANAFNSKPGDPNWNPNSDINCDNKVNILDAIVLGNYFNQKWT